MRARTKAYNIRRHHTLVELQRKSFYFFPDIYTDNNVFIKPTKKDTSKFIKRYLDDNKKKNKFLASRKKVNSVFVFVGRCFFFQIYV